MKPFTWKKKGLLQHGLESGFTHASHPCIVKIQDDEHLIAFTGRKKNRSHIFLAKATVREGHIRLDNKPIMALTPGPLGHFDCDGAISVCFVPTESALYLYYVGWQNLPNSMWICDTGRLLVDAEALSLTREYPGPVIGRSKEHGLFAAATAFLIIDGVWHTWYNSGLQWEELEDGGIKHYYGIHHATSRNGVDWDIEPGMVIPFADEYEYAFGRPTVIKMKDRYCMWFAHRATREIDTYRIGFASSHDALTWRRNDALAGIDVAANGWDSQMICYPYVIEHAGFHYMLYNGNDYGRTGFGYAVLEED